MKRTAGSIGIFTKGEKTTRIKLVQQNQSIAACKDCGTTEARIIETGMCAGRCKPCGNKHRYYVAGGIRLPDDNMRIQGWLCRSLGCDNTQKGAL